MLIPSLTMINCYLSTFKSLEPLLNPMSFKLLPVVLEQAKIRYIKCPRVLVQFAVQRWEILQIGYGCRVECSFNGWGKATVLPVGKPQVVI